VNVAKEKTYKIVRGYFNDYPKEVIRTGLTLLEARVHCKSPETSSKTCKLPENVRRTEERGPWFDGYDEET
jgi:hypothetical protein